MKKTKYGTNMFPPLTLTTEQEAEFRHLARGLVRETLTQANSFHKLPESERDLTKQKRWKRVKTQGSLTAFKERHPPKIITGTSFDTPEHQRLTDDEWQRPKLLVGIGFIVGSLDDVMYGVVTPDTQAMLIKADTVRSSLANFINHCNFEDGAVLAQIDVPTPDAPYRFLGIKWFDKGPPTMLRSFVPPQDLVILEATGVITRSNGDRVGYQLLHSVDLDGYGTLPGHWLTRGKISSCTIFREMQDGRQLDVYARGYVEQHSKLLNSAALKAASTELLSSWNAVEYSDVKKLRWFLENPHLVTWKQDAATRFRGRDAGSPVQSHASTNGSSRSSTLTSSNGRCGGICARKIRKADLCSLCQLPMCTKCRVTKKLTFATCELKLERQESIICRSCVAKVRLEPVPSIVHQESRWRQAHSVKAQAPTPAVPSPSSGYARSNPTSGPHFFLRESNTSKHLNVEYSGTAAGLLDRRRRHQLEQEQSQASNAQLGRPRPYWFRHHKKREHICDDSRPVLFGKDTMLSECQAFTPSQCSTVADIMSTTSSNNPLAYSWPLSVQESENHASLDENDEDGRADISEFIVNTNAKSCGTKCRSCDSPYQIAKRTTVSCCGPCSSPLRKTSGQTSGASSFRGT